MSVHCCLNPLKACKITSFLHHFLHWYFEWDHDIAVCRVGCKTVLTPWYCSCNFEADLEFSRLEFLQVLVSVLVLNLGILVMVLVLEPSSLGLGLGTSDHEDSVFVTHEAWNWDRIENRTLNYNNTMFKSLHPLLEKVFCPPATSAPVERIFSLSGLLMRANRARIGDNMLSQLVYLRCNK